MKRLAALAAPAFACLALCLLAAPIQAADEFKARIDAIVNDPALAATHGGVCIIDMADPAAAKTLYSLRANETFVPASNIKLLTTAAALDQLGADFKFVTTFALREGSRGNDLLVFASGDPGLGDDRLAAKRKEAIEAPFVAVAEALKKAKIDKIAGDLVVDATVFDDVYFHPNWPADQRDKWSEAEVGGFNFNDNCIDVRCSPGAEAGAPGNVELTPNTRCVRVTNKTKTLTEPLRTMPPLLVHRQGLSNAITVSGKVQARGGDPICVPITNPPAFAAGVLIDVLAREGITLAGKIRFERLRLAKPAGGLPPGLTVLYRHEQRLDELVWRCNTFSQNFVAECLFKALGAYDGKSADPAGTGGWATGQAAVLAFLTRQKLPAPAGLVLDDGSGLSKSNQVSPALLGDLLVHMAAHPASKAWLDALATPGADGTLRKRFRNLAAGEALLAKTGTLNNAIALSGYVRTRDKKQYAFSILFDKCRGWSDREAARQATDKIVAVLLGDAPKSAAAAGKE